jgi:GNAT superfamily N-acetyltransferase
MVKGMEKTFKIRRADLNDLEVLTHLFDGYRQFYEQSSDVEGARAFLMSRMEQHESVLFLAENESGKALGFTQLYPTFSSVRMKPVWILNDLFVARNARKLGVANALMEAAEQWARVQGAAGLELATAKDNITAKSVYDARQWKLDEAYDHYSITL